MSSRQVSPGWPGLIEAYRSTGCRSATRTPVVTLQEGNTPLLPAPGAVPPHRLRGLPQGRGRQPDRLVQGPRHDDGHHQGRRGGREGGHLRLDRQHQRQRRRLRRPGRHHLRRARAAGQDRAGQARPGAGARRPAAAGRGQLRRLPGAGQQARDRLPGEPGQHRQPVPHRGAEDRVVRDRRRARRRPRHPLPAGRQRRQHHRLLEGLPRVRRRRQRHAAPRGCGASRPPAPPRSSPARSCENPTTIATAIRIGNPASWTKALDARDESGGRIDAVTDREILAAYRLLARSEAVFVEPASAASVAGLLQVAAAGELEPGQRVVCTVTGNGLKDPEWAISGAPAPLTIPVDAAAAAAQLGL